MAVHALKIGDLARETGTKVVTIRYYEKIGLLPKPERSSGNYRAYTGGTLDRLHFIRRCRTLGFPLDQIRALLDLSSDAARPCAAVCGGGPARGGGGGAGGLRGAGPAPSKTPLRRGWGPRRRG